MESEKEEVGVIKLMRYECLYYYDLLCNPN